jgi:MFS family permease
MAFVRTIVANFSPLRIRNFRIYLGGQAISLIGTWLQVTAQGWVVWQLTGSTVELGTVQMLNTLPLFVLAPWAGSWADRFDRRKLLIITQLGMMVLAFLLALLVLTGVIQVWHIYVLSLFLGIFSALDFPAQQTFLGDLAGASSEMKRAVNLNITIVQVSRMLGPAVAGLVVGALGAGMAFFLNGLSFVAVVASLLMVRATQTQSKTKYSSSALRGFGEAVNFLRDQPRLVDCIIFAALATFFGISIVLNILPAVASTVLNGDATTLGLLMSASGAGALVGVSVIAPIMQAQKRIGVVMALAGLCAGIAFFLLGVTQVLPVAMLGLFCAGLAMPSLMSTTMGLLQVSAPVTMRARVMSLFTMVSFGFQPLAAVWIGWSAELLGIQTAILVNATCLIAVSLFMLSRGALRRWDGVAGIAAQPTEALAAHG